MKRISKIALVKIFLSGILLGTFAFITQDGVTWSSLITPPQEIATTISAPPKILFETIELPEAIRLFNSKRVTFLDIREKRFFDYGSIEGAENLPLENLNTITSDDLKRWKQQRAVVTYCNGTECGTAYYVARQLAIDGLNNVKVYSKGWPEWRSCRLPMAMSAALKKEEVSNAESE